MGGRSLQRDVAARATHEDVRRLLDQQVAVVSSSQLGRTQLERPDQASVRVTRLEALDARPQLRLHRRARDGRTMRPPAPADLGIDRGIEQLAEVHLAFGREPFR